MNSSQVAHANHPARQPAPQPKPKRRVSPGPVEPELREVMIAEAAYYIAERRGFEPGAELDDWLEAESGIDQLLAAFAAEGDEEDEPEGVRSPE